MLQPRAETRAIHRFVLFAAVALVMSWSSQAHAQCDTDHDCKGGRVCKEGSCADPGCTKDTECDGDDICVDGVCRAPGTQPAETAPAAAAPAPSAPPPRPAPTGPPPTWDNPSPTYDRPEPETELIPALYITGPIVFGVPYIIGVAVAVAVNDEADRGKATGIALIPLAGPFIAPTQFDIEEGALVGVYTLGALQLIGASLTVMGLTIRRPVEVPEHALLGDENSEFSVAPGAFDGGAGLVLRLGPPSASF